MGLILFFGGIVGFSLGLTGGGGSIFAVPLLVYGLSVGAHQAVGISLASVGATAMVGALQRIHAGSAEVRTGLLFAAAGMAGAPLGTWIGHGLPDRTRLLLFCVVMVTIATRMFAKAKQHPMQGIPLPERGGRGGRDGRVDAGQVDAGRMDPSTGAPCVRDASGALKLTSRCAIVMALLGISVGILAGLFGVGGGFIIVPALVFFAHMEVSRAMATSLMVIALTSVSGVVSYLVSGEALDWSLTGLFVVGGIVGLVGGTFANAALSGPRLMRIFGTLILLMAGWVIVRSI